MVAIDTKRVGDDWRVLYAGARRSPIDTRWTGQGGGTTGCGRNTITSITTWHRKVSPSISPGRCEAVNIPVIASGGRAPCPLLGCSNRPRAALGASVFHSGRYPSRAQKVLKPSKYSCTMTVNFNKSGDWSRQSFNMPPPCKY